MEQLIIDFIKSFDFQNIISFGLICWFFYRKLNSQIDSKLDTRFNALDTRLGKLEEKILDIDRRLCRIEGAMSAKECCVLKDERNLKKAE